MRFLCLAESLTTSRTGYSVHRSPLGVDVRSPSGFSALRLPPSSKDDGASSLRLQPSSETLRVPTARVSMPVCFTACVQRPCDLLPWGSPPLQRTQSPGQVRLATVARVPPRALFLFGLSQTLEDLIPDRPPRPCFVPLALVGFLPSRRFPATGLYRARRSAIPSRRFTHRSSAVACLGPRKSHPQGVVFGGNPFFFGACDRPAEADALLGFIASVVFCSSGWGGVSTVHPLLVLIPVLASKPRPSDLQRLPSEPPASPAIAGAGHPGVCGLSPRPPPHRSVSGDM